MQERSENNTLLYEAEKVLSRNPILDSITDAICILDVNSRKILHANQAFLQSTGLDEDICHCMTCYAATHRRDIPCEESNEVCPLLDVIQTRRTQSVDHIHHGPNGQEQLVEVVVYPIIDPDGKIRRVVHISRDITYRKGLEKQLLQKTEELLKLNLDLHQKVYAEIEKRLDQEDLILYQSRLATMGEMMKAMTHQWKQPVANLGVIVEDMRDILDTDELDRDYLNQALKDARGQIDFMSHVIEDFRNFFSPSASVQVFDVQEAIHELLRLFFRSFHAIGIEIQILYEEYKPQGLVTLSHELLTRTTDNFPRLNGNYKVIGYRNQFQHAILNLMNNAKDALLSRNQSAGMESSRPFIIRIGIGKKEEQLLIAVSDSGPGIPEDMRKKVFENHFSTKTDGFGMGLYIVKKIITDAMGGEVSICPSALGGASFTVSLPSYSS